MDNTLNFTGNGWIELYVKSEKFIYNGCKKIKYYKKENIIMFNNTEVNIKNSVLLLKTFSEERKKNNNHLYTR